MSAPYPPPPPTYAPRKARPSAVTKYATYMFVAGIIITVLAVLEFVFYGYPWYVFGIITAVLAALTFIDGLGLFIGQRWALTFSGYSRRAWAQAPDVREFFGLPPAYPAYPPSVPAAAPPSPICPTCGQPLTYVQQYQRWYCDKEQKYV